MRLENTVGVVAIGRNEGERLKKCLDSVVGITGQIVYVDSGSSDGSVEMARAMGVEAVELDAHVPFTAARARNAGYARLIQCYPLLRFVQFIDGDCEIIGDWLPLAVVTLENQPELAIVAGWLRERSPNVSIYNRLADMEWNFFGPGDVVSVGGIFMIRRAAFDGVGGFDATIVAGEEPEFCQRLVREGWRLLRLDHNMASHDLAMTRFGQWWRRMVRIGYGSTDVATRFGLPRFRRSNLRARFWTTWLVAVLIVGSLAAAVPLGGGGALLALALFSLWPLQFCRIAMRSWRNGQPLGLAGRYAFFLMISFWPQMVGQLVYWADRMQKRSFRLFEYKTTSGSGTGRGA